MKGGRIKARLASSLRAKESKKLGKDRTNMKGHYWRAQMYLSVSGLC